MQYIRDYLQLAAPFNTIHPPVEDFGKLYHSTSELQMHLAFVWFLNKVYHRGIRYFTQKCHVSLSTGNSTLPMWEMFFNCTAGVVWNTNGVTHYAHYWNDSRIWTALFLVFFFNAYWKICRMGIEFFNQIINIVIMNVYVTVGDAYNVYRLRLLNFAPLLWE